MTKQLRGLELRWNFTSINKLRKDIWGYKTPYILTIKFATHKNTDLQLAKDNIQATINNQIVKIVEGKNLIEYCSKTDTTSILDWVVKRLKRHFPKKGIEVQSVSLEEHLKEKVTFETSRTSKESSYSMRIDKGTLFINNKISDVASLPFNKRIILFRRTLDKFSLRSNIGQLNKYSNKNDWGKIVEMMRNKPNEQYVLCTFVCPPYINDTKLGYVGLFNSVFDDPRKYNFDYNYPEVFSVLQRLIKLGEVLGLHLMGLVVYCDWGLINIDSIRKHFGSDEKIVEQLGMFYKTLQTLSTKYSNVEVTRLSNFKVNLYLPIGLPYSSKARKDYIEQITSIDADNLMEYLDIPLIKRVLTHADDNSLVRYIDWRNFKDFNELGNKKGEIVSIFKTYNNITWMKINKIKKNTNIKDLISGTNSQIRNEAIYDTLLRYVEYKIYGNLISRSIRNTICVYQDPGFPMAGHHFRNDHMPVLFIDPALTLQNISHVQ